MATKKGQYKIPFHPEHGGVMHWPERLMRKGEDGKYHEVDLDWRDNYEFKAILVYQGYRRGRSAAYFLFKEAETEAVHSMFMSDFDDIARSMINGHVLETWTFHKKGQNYGIRMVSPTI